MLKKKDCLVLISYCRVLPRELVANEAAGYKN